MYNKTVSIGKLKEELCLESFGECVCLEREIVIADIHRPGVELTGYFIEKEVDIENKLHIVGKQEMDYLYSLRKAQIYRNVKHYFEYDFPCLILCDGVKVHDAIISVAKEYGTAILHSNESVEVTSKKIKDYLDKELAPEIVLKNMIFMEVFGMGILFMGDIPTRIGTAIELLEKGQRFVTDEILVLKRISDNTILGINSYGDDDKEDSRYFLTLQNGDEVNAIDRFGVGGTRRAKELDMIIRFEPWDNKKFYDRLGLDEETQYILGLEIPKVTIPVRKGRNMAVIVETAAINQRLKLSGKSSAQYFSDEMDKIIKENQKMRRGGKMKFLTSLNLKEISEKFNLKVLNGEDELEDKMVHTSDLHRPSLEFTGFYDTLKESGENKIQVLGEIEMKYIDRLPMDQKMEYLGNYLNFEFPCIILTGVKNAPPFFINIVKEKNIILLSTEEKIGEFILEFREYLQRHFAPKVTMHGVLVEVFGFGVFLVGKSGIGKSETALELIHRSHRLIADDMVVFKQSTDGRVIGSAEKLPYFMEIRGLGIIDVKSLYGLGAVRKSKQLDVIIELNEFNEKSEKESSKYRMEELEILGKKIPKIVLHISQGRSAASMVEIATMNLRAKRLGYDATEAREKLYKEIAKKDADDER